MGGHDHHEPPIKIPDWRVYKIENCPPLKDVERMLAQKGLKDPWLRNHVWKYPPELPMSQQRRLFSNVFTGWKTGLAFFLVVLTGEYTYKFFSPPADHGQEHH